jgi:hypothetical protein
MAKYDTSEMLDAIQRRGVVPTNQGTFSSLNLLQAAQEELESELLPDILRHRGEHLLFKTDIALVAGTALYRIPYRSVGNGLRELALIDSDGRTRPLDEYTRADLDKLELDEDDTGTPDKFWIEGAFIRVHPVPTSGDTSRSLRASYHMKPNRMVLTTSCRLITAIATDTPTAGKTRLTVAAVPSTWGGTPKLDLVRGAAPFDVLQIDAVPQSSLTASVSTTIDLLSTAIPADLTANQDYVALAGETPFANIPGELHIIAALLGAATVVGGQGDHRLADRLRKEAEGKATKAGVMLNPRVKAKSRDILPADWF